MDQVFAGLSLHTAEAQALWIFADVLLKLIPVNFLNRERERCCPFSVFFLLHPCHLLNACMHLVLRIVLDIAMVVDLWLYTQTVLLFEAEETTEMGNDKIRIWQATE